MTRIPAPDLGEPQFLILSLTLSPGLGAGPRRRFYSQMRRALRPMDLMLCRCKDVCLLVQVGQLSPYDFRSAVLSWLIEQSEPRQIVIHPLHSVCRYFVDGVDLVLGEETLDPPALAFAQLLFDQMLIGLVQRGRAQRALLGLVSP